MYGNVMRVSPPMNIAHTEVDQFIELLDHSLPACRATASGKAR
jgi:4-aminobutyrate aminotransferase-like enzyme